MKAKTLFPIRLKILLATPEAKRNMAAFLELGGQTRAGEARMGDLCAELGRATSD